MEKNTERYILLTDRMETLRAQAEAGTPLAEVALIRAELELSNLSTDGTVYQELGELHATAKAQLAQLDELEITTDGLDIISPEEIDNARREIFESPGYRASCMIIGTSAVEATVQVEPVAVGSTPPSAPVPLDNQPPELATAEADTEPIEVKITIQGSGIQIGERGKFIKLSKRTHEGQQDYSLARRELLKTLVEHQGDMVPTQLLWGATFGDSTPYDKSVMGEFKRWAEQVTYRRKALVTHNGKRGPSSAYGIVDHRVELSEVTTKIQPEIEDISARLPLIDIQPVPIVKTGLQTKSPQAVMAEKDISKVDFPLNLTESLLLAEVLATFSDFCTENNVQAIPDKILDSLKQKLDNAGSAIAVELAPFGGDVIAKRTELIEKLIAYFDNSKAVLNDIDRMNAKDNRRELFEYLFEIEWDELDGVLRAIVSGNTQQVIVYGGRRGVDVVDVLRVDPSKAMTQPTLGITIDDGEIGDSAAATEMPLTPREDTVMQQEDAKAENLPIVEDEPTSENDVEEPELLNHTEKDLQRMEEIREEIRDSLKLIKEYKLDGKNAKSVMGAFPYMKQTHIKNASENGHIGRDGKLLNSREILTIISLVKFAEECSRTKRSKTNIDLHDVKNVIEELISESR